jgi:hypothetical protein
MINPQHTRFSDTEDDEFFVPAPKLKKKTPPEIIVLSDIEETTSDTNDVDKEVDDGDDSDHQVEIDMESEGDEDGDMKENEENEKERDATQDSKGMLTEFLEE